MDINEDTMQSDVRELLRALALSDHARPCSCHDVIQNEVLPKIKELREHLEAFKPIHGRPGEFMECWVPAEVPTG